MNGKNKRNQTQYIHASYEQQQLFKHPQPQRLNEMKKHHFMKIKTKMHEIETQTQN